MPKLCCFTLFCALLTMGTGEKLLFGEQFQNLQYANPDSKGFGYCAYWKLPDGTHLYSVCDPYTMERCGQKAEFDYKCCPSFEEEKGVFSKSYQRDATDCVRVVSPYKSCAENILQSPKTSGFAADVMSVREMRTPQVDQPYTIFAPHMDDDGNNGEYSAEEHVVKGRYYAHDLRDGMELEAVDGRRKLYVQRQTYGVTTVDCSEIIDVDSECRGGLVHKIRRPIGGGPGGTDADITSVLSLLQSIEEARQFASDLPPALQKKLGDPSYGMRYTVLLPTHQSWEAVRRKYQGEKLAEIAAIHVLPKQMCSASLIQSEMRKESVSGEHLDVTCSVVGREEKRHVMAPCGQKVAITEADLTANNGVVHMIEDAIIPLSVNTLDELKSNKQCHSELKIKEFMELLEECDLGMVDGEKYAIIMPQDESFTWWSNYPQFREEYDRFQVDKDYRCRVARYHIVPNNGDLDNMNQFGSNTNAHATNNVDRLYETTYFKRTSSGPQLNFHYSPVPDMQAIEMDGVTIYRTTRVNVPPEKYLNDILKERLDTKISNNMTVKAQMKEKHFEPNAPKNLYLVSTDDGWKDPRETPGSANPYRPEITMYNGKGLENFLLLHHVPLYLWGGDIGYFDKPSVHKFMSSAGIMLTFWMDDSGTMRIGHDEMPRESWPRVVKFNLPAKDGIMWLLDGPITCPISVCPLFVEDVDYYDVYVSACRVAELPGDPDAKRLFRAKPLEVAKRHPEDCTVLLQLSEKSVRRMEV